jgi:nickel/cobalt transporter (NicO) family protein
VLPEHGWPIAATYAIDRANRDLYGVAARLILGIGYLVSSIALVLGFAHEGPTQIVAICAGSASRLEVMLVYSLAVILVPTPLPIAGYERHRETVERYTPWISTVAAVVLILVGTAFVVGIV